MDAHFHFHSHETLETHVASDTQLAVENYKWMKAGTDGLEPIAAEMHSALAQTNDCNLRFRLFWSSSGHFV